MKIQMLVTAKGAVSDAGNIAREYAKGGVFTTPLEVPTAVAEAFVEAGLAKEINPAPTRTEPAPVKPPETKPEPKALKREKKG